MHQFSIITPTYNRAEYLPAVFECLKKQENTDLEWIIIDDGSNDHTKHLVSKFNSPFKILYHYQQNSGKPQATNMGVSLATSRISLIHDDDDALFPNILPLVWQYYNPMTETFRENCVCLSGLCVYDTGEIIGDKFLLDYSVSDNIECRYNQKIKGDKCEFYLTSVLKEYPFPILKNEKFIVETVVWNRIALKHKTIYINEIFQRKTFLKGGLSDQPIWDNSPLGSELYFNEATNKKFSLINRLKNFAKYIHWAKINNKNILQIYRSSFNRCIFIPGLFFYLLLKTWYCIKNIPFVKNRLALNKWKKIT